MNIAGLIVLGLGAVLVITALRGTQGALFPGIFTSPTSTPNITLNPGGQSVKPSGGKCPDGFVMGSDGQCYINVGG